MVCFVHLYPGQIVSTLGQAEILFEAIKRLQEKEGLDPWGHFADGEEWNLGLRNLPSCQHNYMLMKAINKLPQSSEWKLKCITIEGDLLGTDGQCQKEGVELWMGDLNDCICELMVNSTFWDAVCFKQQQVFDDKEGKTRQYDKM
ncbi:hypothetical protein BDN67DRAFT_984494 [Paxillus ammoniavirescens]|nr:hypothetical protein BDN67DRAFT_984494 [Paxillus ammoniavirescens]